ncbi:efflux RND transporter permease subunit [Pelagibacterium luteolum]|uniref:Multidrug efflux pump subunit AcrB n=1 Tax=Pelagibacterium luteolum TaxID=440168 RepID=A0A1G7YJ80_9HYPH|nr:efflux RND transporter permease subunit [Pelagibacterium luteolum]SDG96386.1 Multidrug efflux pump subunit AcrB [Pelagibacterium luteolum]
MKKFNLSDWAIEHSALVWYFMIACTIAGAAAYIGLGREEDPSFTIKTMVIQAQWPGASAEETARQVTDRIERKVEELDNLDFTRSMTTAGQAIVFVNLEADVPPDDVLQTWQRVRNMMADMALEFPGGVVGPFVDDRFGDVYGNVYAFTGDGMTWRQLRDHVEDVRAALLTVPDIGRIEIIGAQREVVFLEFSTRQIAALGLDHQSILTSIQEQNAIVPSGVVQIDGERVALRVGGSFTSEEDLETINLRVNDRFFPLSEVATITRGYQDPPESLFRFNGEPALGLAVSMKAGANLLDFGAALDETVARAERDLPVGIDIHKVSDQPHVVDHAVSHFVRALAEAVIIVLAISFISLGLRAGLVVAVSIPLVLAITFLGMQFMDISLQRVSLGALIIALGLLVDDAMIAVEMMVSRLEVGDTLRKAATHVYTSTAFPMLTGTLVTVAGFLPVVANFSLAGQFASSLFYVIAISLIMSWVVAVVFTPLLGMKFLPNTLKHTHEKKGRVGQTFRTALLFCMRRRWLTIGATALAFTAALASMAMVQVQLFPASDRNELVVNFTLPQNSTVAETSARIAQFEREALSGKPGIDHWSTYVGRGAARFLLTLDPPVPGVSMGQVIIETESLEARDRIRAELEDYISETFIEADVDIRLLEIGPPIGIPIQYRVSGPDIEKVRTYAQDLASLLDQDSRLGNITFDWMEPARVVRVELLQDRARMLGISSQDIALALNGIVDGMPVTQIRDDIYLIDVIGRAAASERASMETLENLQLPSASGRSIPLGAIATFSHDVEQPVIWQRSRVPTLTVRAEPVGDMRPLLLTFDKRDEIAAFAQTLPAGYSVETGGEWEESIKTLLPVVAGVPLMLIVMATILMIQLQSFHLLAMVFLTAPLAVIGVAIALVPTGIPLGFIAVLGILALAGILIRNSVILIVQIETLRKKGMAAWDAVVEATEHRMRPIMLTAAAASLALIPISREVFWGPMAYAMMGGIVVGTVLTLLFLPALYVAWFGIQENPQKASQEESPIREASAPAS